MRINKRNIFLILVILIILLLIRLTLCSYPKNYLLKPTGQYGIGYQDISLINKSLCPDPFYIKNKNENNFSPSNSKYCHEILLRIYYPADIKNNLGDKYYLPVLKQDVDYFLRHYPLSPQNKISVQSILNIKTYTHREAKPYKGKKFPIVVFLPGAGQPAQTYTNIISNLVSHGYVVIGVNSLFLNGPLQLENGR